MGRKVALDSAAVFVAVLCDDHSRSGAGRIFRFFGKDREKFCIFLFLSIWECNSRYLVCFIPVMILTASDGLTQGWKLLVGWKEEREKEKSKQVSSAE